MTFNPGARLDPDQVTDVRGRSYGGGRGIAIGGGGIGLVIAIVYVLLGGNPGDLATVPQGGVAGPVGSQLTQECRTGTQARTSRRRFTAPVAPSALRSTQRSGRPTSRGTTHA